MERSSDLAQLDLEPETHPVTTLKHTKKRSGMSNGETTVSCGKTDCPIFSRPRVNVSIFKGTAAVAEFYTLIDGSIITEWLSPRSGRQLYMRTPTL